VATTTTFPEIVYPDGFDERRESEMAAKGYLGNVIVRTERDRQYQVNFIDPVRLAQDLSNEAESGRPYFAEPGLIVVPDVTINAIRKAVEGLVKEGFFEALKPVPLNIARSAFERTLFDI
jgi:hypothetical protein